MNGGKPSSSSQNVSPANQSRDGSGLQLASQRWGSRKSYTTEFKLGVVSWVERNRSSIRKAARHFKVDRKMVRAWLEGRQALNWSLEKHGPHRRKVQSKRHKALGGLGKLETAPQWLGGWKNDSEGPLASSMLSPSCQQDEQSLAAPVGEGTCLEPPHSIYGELLHPDSLGQELDELQVSLRLLERPSKQDLPVVALFDTHMHRQCCSAGSGLLANRLSQPPFPDRPELIFIDSHSLQTETGH